MKTANFVVALALLAAGAANAATLEMSSNTNQSWVQGQMSSVTLLPTSAGVSVNLSVGSAGQCVLNYNAANAGLGMQMYAILQQVVDNSKVKIVCVTPTESDNGPARMFSINMESTGYNFNIAQQP